MRYVAYHGLFLLLFTQCATSNASRHFKSPLAMGRDAFKSKHASSVSSSGVIDTGVNSNYPIQYSIDPAPVIKLLIPSFYPNKYNFTP